LADNRSAQGLLIAAPSSGSGKTLFTLGLAAALGQRGQKVAPVKTGPDYIDKTFLTMAAGKEAINLDPWAMAKSQLRARATEHGQKADLLLIEGVMGLFDGAANGHGSSADLAAILQVPVILVVDAGHQSHSIAPLVSGFVNWHKEVKIAAIILNNVGSTRHETLLRGALDGLKIPLLGAIPRNPDLKLPERHLGLVLPQEIANGRDFIAKAAQIIASHCDLDKICDLATPVAAARSFERLAPLGQNIAIAKDAAFISTGSPTGWIWGLISVFFIPWPMKRRQKTRMRFFCPGAIPNCTANSLPPQPIFLLVLRRPVTGVR